MNFLPHSPQSGADAPPGHWTAGHVAAIRRAAETTIALVAPRPVPLIDALDLWDLWPLQHANGSTALVEGWSVWFVLSAPRLPDPEARHNVARIRLMSLRGGEWRDHGNALPDGLCPGSREWAGSARFDAASGQVNLFWTAAGHSGDGGASFAQRMFVANAALAVSGSGFALANWTAPEQIAGGDIDHYVEVTAAQGIPGTIKGFRDPAHFVDPADGQTYLLFTGSLKHSPSAWNGCIGLLRADRATGAWEVLPPLLSADKLNNEQERPHIVMHGGRYYLFWSTQRKVFADSGPSGPTGLYGMVADTLAGPWHPLNGTALVAGNPDGAPYQTYSWWVTGALSVHGFVDYPGVAADERQDDAAWRRTTFGGVPAPVFTLALDGDIARIADAAAA